MQCYLQEPEDLPQMSASGELGPYGPVSTIIFTTSVVHEGSTATKAGAATDSGETEELGAATGCRAAAESSATAEAGMVCFAYTAESCIPFSLAIFVLLIQLQMSLRPAEETIEVVVQDDEEAADEPSPAGLRYTTRCGILQRISSSSLQSACERTVWRHIGNPFDILPSACDEKWDNRNRFIPLLDWDDESGSLAIGSHHSPSASNTSVEADAATDDAVATDAAAAQPVTLSTAHAILRHIKCKVSERRSASFHVSAQPSLGAISGPLSGESSSASAWGSPSLRGRLRKQATSRFTLDVLMDRSMAGEAGRSQAGAVSPAEERDPWGEHDNLRQQGCDRLRTENFPHMSRPNYGNRSRKRHCKKCRIQVRAGNSILWGGR